MLRRAVGLLAVGACGLLLAVAAFGQQTPGGGGTGPPEWVPGPPPCHGHSPCPPPSTSTVTNATTTTVARTSTSTTTISTTTTVRRTSTLELAGPPGPSSGTDVADIGVAVTSPAGEAFAGSEVTYTATVTNAGPSQATGVHLAVMPAGSRVLSSAAGDLGELDAGASTTVSVTLVPNGPGTMAVTFAAGADQTDPNPGDNVEVLSMPVLAGHSGPPILQTGTQGAFTPPLLAVRKGDAWVVATRVHVDEPAAMTVRVLDGSGNAQTMLPGTLVDWLPAMRPHASIPHVLTAPGWMPLKLVVGGAAGRRYRIVVQAVGPDGSTGSTTIPFRTP